MSDINSFVAKVPFSYNFKTMIFTYTTWTNLENKYREMSIANKKSFNDTILNITLK